MKPLDCVIKLNKRKTRRRGGDLAAQSRPQTARLHGSSLMAFFSLFYRSLEIWRSMESNILLRFKRHDSMD